MNYLYKYLVINDGLLLSNCDKVDPEILQCEEKRKNLLTLNEEIESSIQVLIRGDSLLLRHSNLADALKHTREYRELLENFAFRIALASRFIDDKNDMWSLLYPDLLKMTDFLKIRVKPYAGKFENMQMTIKRAAELSEIVESAQDQLPGLKNWSKMMQKYFKYWEMEKKLLLEYTAYYQDL